MANKQSMSADEYYKDYLRQTLNQDEEHSASSKNIIIGLLSTIVIGGGYYVWQQQNHPTIPIVQQKTNIEHVAQNVEKKILKEPSQPTIAQKTIVKPRKEVVTTITPKTLHPISVSSKPKIEKSIKKPIVTKVQPVIKVEKKPVEKKVILPSIVQAKISQESREINDLAQALLSGIVESKTPTKEQKTTKVDTFNKVVIEQKVKPSQKQNNTTLKRKDTSKGLTSVLENSNKEKNTYTKALKVEAKTREDEMQFVVVKKGDTLFYIAKRIYGDAMKYTIIFEANPDILNDPARISIGQKLRVPKLKKADS